MNDQVVEGFIVFQGEAPTHVGRRNKDLGALRRIGRGSQSHTLLLVFAAEHPGGLTGDEACVRAGLLLGRPSSRITELGHAGYLEPTGERRTTRAGGTARVLRLTDAGVTAVATLNRDPELRVYRPDDG